MAGVRQILTARGNTMIRSQLSKTHCTVVLFWPLYSMLPLDFGHIFSFFPGDLEVTIMKG